jgi:5-formyltetrahydrofolate cyclo-ligase
MDDKLKLRARMRTQRRDYVDALPTSTRALLFMRPPAPVAAWAPEGSTVALYHATPAEAPTRAYARWFHDNGRRIALPWFADRGAPMRFRLWHDPYDDSALTAGPFGQRQPLADAEEAIPDLAFVPLIAFTARGERLGQGGGHYDRWLAAHPATSPVGLAWDSQLIASLPTEPHDRRLRAVVTPTRLYEGDI